MTESNNQHNEKLQFSNLLDSNKLVFFSVILFLLSSLIDWQRSSFFIYTGYSFFDLFNYRGGWPNFVPLTLVAAVINLILTFPFMKPHTNEQNTNFRKLATTQLALSIVGLLAMLDFIRVAIVWDQKILFGGWLALLFVILMLYGAIKTRSHFA